MLIKEEDLQYIHANINAILAVAEEQREVPGVFCTARFPSTVKMNQHSLVLCWYSIKTFRESLKCP